VCCFFGAPSFFIGYLQKIHFLKKIKSKNALGNNKFFDPKMGLVGAIVLGITVFIINFGHGAWPAFTASTKQAAYTLLAGGFMMRLTENIASSFEKNWLAISLATFIPTAIAVILTYGVHSLKGTPEPFNSTIPTMVMAPFGFLWWAVRKRKQLKSLSLSPQNKIDAKK
jgi:hypothetical protein